MSYLKPSQCDIKKISITNHTKTTVIDKQSSFLEFFHSLDIFENIFNPFITADLVLIDGASFIEKHNITGDEDFEIEFQGYGSDEVLTYKLKVAELVYNVPTPNLRSKNVSLRLTSNEFLTDSSIAISKSYKASTKDIITDIIKKQLGSNKNIFTEDTKDLPCTLIPFLTPFQSIDFVRQRLVSQKYKSSTFLFFETSDGYFLTTVEGLYERDKSKAQKFFQREATTENVKGAESVITDFDSFRLFSNYTVKSSFNLNHSLKNGGLTSVISQYDFTTKKFETRVFQNSPSNSIFVDSTNGKNPLITSTIYNKFSQNKNKPYLLPFSKYKDTNNNTTNFLFDTLAERLCFSNLFTMEKTYIDIPGNTRVSAGSIILLEVPRYDAKESKEFTNQMSTGYYMVTACKHSVTNADTAKYDTHLELMRFGRGILE